MAGNRIWKRKVWKVCWVIGKVARRRDRLIATLWQSWIAFCVMPDSHCQWPILTSLRSLNIDKGSPQCRFQGWNGKEKAFLGNRDLGESWRRTCSNISPTCWATTTNTGDQTCYEIWQTPRYIWFFDQINSEGEIHISLFIEEKDTLRSLIWKLFF